MDQLTQIMKVTGVPGPEFIQKLDSLEVCQTTVDLNVYMFVSCKICSLSAFLSVSRHEICKEKLIARRLTAK